MNDWSETSIKLKDLHAKREHALNDKKYPEARRIQDQIMKLEFDMTLLLINLG